jgi:hypothetical protein
MQNELLFALLGFTGDIIVEDQNSFKVCDGFDLFNQAEKDQVNRIVPLGFLYCKLEEYVREFDITWNNSNVNLYKAALAQGVNDLLKIYADDVTYFEQYILQVDSVVPLSHTTQFFQKVCIINNLSFVMN